MHKNIRTLNWCHMASKITEKLYSLSFIAEVEKLSAALRRQHNFTQNTFSDDACRPTNNRSPRATGNYITTLARSSRLRRRRRGCASMQLCWLDVVVVVVSPNRLRRRRQSWFSTRRVESNTVRQISPYFAHKILP